MDELRYDPNGNQYDDDAIVLPFDAGQRARAAGAVSPLPTTVDPKPNSDPKPLIATEDWLSFRATAGEEVPFLVDGLWPEGALGFIASPPKAGKTWIGIALALSLVTASPYLGTFPVRQRRNVLYVALEGNRAAINARISAIARGIGTDPNEQIAGLTIAYKPRGINLSDKAWADALIDAAKRCNADLVIVDVLRSAARIKENDASDFADLVANVSGLAADNISIAFLHHFTKLSETSKERTPMERMSGSGAMGGALDVGIYITGSADNARRLRLDFDCRDITSPNTLSIALEGEGSGTNGSFTADDKIWWWSTAEVPEDSVKVSSDELADWIKDQGQDVTKAQIAAAFECSERTIERREPKLEKLGVEIVKVKGKPNAYRWIGLPEPEPQQTLDTPDTTPDTTPDSTHDTHHDTPTTADPCRGSNPHKQAETPTTRPDPRQTPDVVGANGLNKPHPTHDNHDTLRVDSSRVGGRPPGGDQTDYDAAEIARLEELARTYGMGEDE